MYLCLITLFDIGDPIARRFLNTWSASIDANGVEREFIDKLILGLAIIMRPLVLYYDSQKKRLRILLQDACGFGRDYDDLRKDGSNPRDLIRASTQLENEREMLKVLDNLETIASGLLVLLRPEFIPLAFGNLYNVISSGSSLIDLPSIKEEEKKKFISNLRAHETYSSAYKERSVQLFEALCGEGRGPWKKRTDGKSFGELIETAVNLFKVVRLRALHVDGNIVEMVERSDGSGTCQWSLTHLRLFKVEQPESFLAIGQTLF